MPLVLQKEHRTVVGGLKKEDFVLYGRWDQAGDHPLWSGQFAALSPLELIDRGGCLDPFGSHVIARPARRSRG